MPNWCENTLNVSGPDKEVQKFKLQAKDDSEDNKTALSLNKLFPMPEELRNTTSPSKEPNKELIQKFGFDNWYDWSNHNWGTKWDVTAELCIDKPSSLEYYFDSAWAPPIAAFERISKLFPNLQFELHYKEPGMCFQGTYTVQNGEGEDVEEDYVDDFEEEE